MLLVLIVINARDIRFVLHRLEDHDMESVFRCKADSVEISSECVTLWIYTLQKLHTMSGKQKHTKTHKSKQKQGKARKHTQAANKEHTPRTTSKNAAKTP